VRWETTIESEVVLLARNSALARLHSRPSRSQPTFSTIFEQRPFLLLLSGPPAAKNPLWIRAVDESNKEIAA
jgi:hypothetical protein